jgi:hypothetical protein
MPRSDEITIIPSRIFSGRELGRVLAERREKPEAHLSY